VKKITETSKLNISLVEIILSEEKCGEGMYWCNTNKECKPLPSGFNTPGQTIKPTEVGIGVPVEGSCNHTKKGKSCPKHGMKDCTLIGKTLNSVTEEGLRAWFGKSKSDGGKPGWVQSNGSPCANEPGETKTPKCFSRSKLASMSKGEIASAVRRKREQDPGQQSKSGAAKPTYVSTDSPTKKMKEEFFKENHKEIADGREKDEEGYMASTEMDTIDSAIKKLRKNIKKSDTQLPAWVQSKITKAADYIDTAADYLDSDEMSEGKKDACYTKVKSRYSVWPSAYASGALVKCRKVGAANWGNKTNEDVTIEDLEGNTFVEVVDLIRPESITGFKSQVEEATRLQADTGNIIAVILSWRGKIYSVRMFFPQVGMPNRKDVTTEIQKVYPDALVLQYKVSGLQPGMPLIQVVNSKSKNYLLNNGTIGEEKIEEEGPVLSVGRGEKLPVSKGAGLTAKGREKYNRKTGSNLQAPVTGDVKPGSKAAKRRKAFCSRSISWKGERGLAARRRWKC
jgi:hypothetical protein